MGHLAGLEKGIGGAVDLGDLAGDPDGKSLPEREAGQRADAAFARGGPLPLAFQLRAERGNGVVSQDDRSRVIMPNHLSLFARSGKVVRFSFLTRE